MLDALIAGNVERVVRLAAQVGKKYGCYGAWQIAVVTTGLDGATSSKTVDSWGDPGPIYTEPTYGKATEATFTELDTEPDNVTARLVLRLLRSLGAHSHPDYRHLSPVSKIGLHPPVAYTPRTSTAAGSRPRRLK